MLGERVDGLSNRIDDPRNNIDHRFDLTNRIDDLRSRLDFGSS